MQAVRLLRNVRDKVTATSSICGPPGELLAWGQEACDTLKPHGFSPADVGSLIASCPKFIVWAPELLLKH